MAPETAFALDKNEAGHLIRYAPVYQVRDEDFLAVDPETGEHDAVRNLLLGLVVSTGSHHTVRARASSLIAPPLLLEGILIYLRRLAQIEMENGMHPKSARVTTHLETAQGTFLRSRVLTKLIGDSLTENSQIPLFDLDALDRRHLWAFLRGLLIASGIEDNNVVFRHRSAIVVKKIAAAMWAHFGVPCTIMVDPMEPEMQQNANLPRSHRFVLDPMQQQYAAYAGLLDGDRTATACEVYDPIVGVKPLSEKLSSVIILPGAERSTPMTANGYVFRPEYEMPSGTLQVATHPSLLDSSDPTRWS